MRHHHLTALLITLSLASACHPEPAADDDDSASQEVGADRIDEVVQALQGSGASAALHEVAWDEGWPLRDGERWLFATTWPGAPGEVSLVGDFNAWEAGAWPAERSGDVYWRVVEDAELTVPAAGAAWKWNAGDDWRAPPEATAYGRDEFGEFGYVAAPLDRSWRERFPALDTDLLGPPRDIRALLPAGFQPGSAAAAGTRSLLMHDGQNLWNPDAFYGGWGVDEILASGAWGDVVVLAVDNADDRLSAYSPVPDDYDGSGSYGGEGPAYVQLLSEHVLPFFRDRYGVTAEGSSLMVAGSSMGGLISLYMALDHPELQGCVAALSPSLWWGAVDPASDASGALVNRWPQVGHTDTAIYLDSGGGPGSGCVDTDNDGVQDDGDGDDNYCETVQLRDVLVSQGYQYEVDLWHWWEPGVPHNEASWNARFFRALDACDAAGWGY